MGNFTLPNGLNLINVHSPSVCSGSPCVIHNPSDHHMRSWPMDWNSNIRCMLRTCPHGVVHPDPDVPHNMRPIHECGCGCCEVDHEAEVRAFEAYRQSLLERSSS